MKTITWFAVGTVAMSAACFGSPSDIAKLNSSISLDANQQAGDLTDINGAIEVGAHCMVQKVNTVNGRIEIGSNSTTGSLTTVNGGVTIGSSTHVSGNATTVNGDMTLDNAADVSGSLTNVNGSIRLAGAHVAHGIETVWGDIEIGRDSHVEGGIRVRRPNSFSTSHPTPKIVIGPGAVVTGALRFDHEVKLYISDSAKVGTVEGATANTYSGDHP